VAKAEKAKEPLYPRRGVEILDPATGPDREMGGEQRESAFPNLLPERAESDQRIVVSVNESDQGPGCSTWRTNV